jgi:DNA-binding NarL/FixJ family response regulator
MAGDLRVLVYSSCAAILAGIGFTLGDGVTDDGPRFVVAGVCSLADLRSGALKIKPDVAVLHGIGRRQVASCALPTRSVVFAIGDDSSGAELLRILRIGVTTFVSIDTDLSGLRQACRCASRDSPYISPSLFRTLVGHLAGKNGAGAPASLRLTAREAQVLTHLAGGLSQSAISETMNIGGRTVKYHLANIYQKLGVHTQREAIVVAYREGLVA